MRSVLHLANQPDEPWPDGFAGPDVRFPARLVEAFLHEYTRPGDHVFDPFAGFGTTLRAAERLGRVPSGVEWDRARYEYARARLTAPDGLIHGDARRLADYDLPPLDFSFTSPPYMMAGDEENPLTNYTEPHAGPSGDGYAAYQRALADVYRALRARTRPGARCVIEVANLRREDSEAAVTTLAWDVARAVGEAVPFEREIVVAWEPTYGFGYDHSYCLVFRA